MTRLSPRQTALLDRLLAVVKESLARLEDKLQGKGMIEFLWNKQENGWRPKEEDAFSRYVADHLEAPQSEQVRVLRAGWVADAAERPERGL